jgi:hypothetical protein
MKNNPGVDKGVKNVFCPKNDVNTRILFFGNSNKLGFGMLAIRAIVQLQRGTGRGSAKRRLKFFHHHALFIWFGSRGFCLETLKNDVLTKPRCVRQPA